MLEEVLNKLSGRVEILENAPAPSGDSRTYKVYTALLTQSGTDAPVATVLENTLGGEVVWSYDDESMFSATSDNLFTLNKTVVFTGSVFNGVIPNSVEIIIDNNNFTTTTLNMQVTFDEGAVVNDLLSNTPIEIRVYN